MTILESYIFSWCSALTSIIIPNRVITIKDTAFGFCTDIHTITIGNSVNSIGPGAFTSCTGVHSITIPNSVTTIATGAFENFSNLRLIKLPSNITSIGNFAFENCIRLDEIIISSLIPPSIDANTFDNPKTISAYVPNEALIAYTNAPIWKEMNLTGEFESNTNEIAINNKIYTHNSKIIITAHSDTTVRIYNINGQRVYDNTINGETQISVPQAGAYIVQIGNKGTTVVVK